MPHTLGSVVRSRLTPEIDTGRTREGYGVLCYVRTEAPPRLAHGDTMREGVPDVRAALDTWLEDLTLRGRAREVNLTERLLG